MTEEKEFNLSEKPYHVEDGGAWDSGSYCMMKQGEAFGDYNYYKETDVKEFIRLLKEKINFGMAYTERRLEQQELMEIIDKLAGEKLI